MIDLTTWEFIKSLSLRDTKSLSQKALKCAEECGELAKAVLPYEDAPGTLHRFGNRAAVLEECVDTILTAVSIAYDIGASHEEINDELLRKSRYIQSVENTIEWPLPFEIHVTVDASTFNWPLLEVSDADRVVAAFREACAEVGVKPLLLDLDLHDAGSLKDLMTSSVHMGSNSSAYAELCRISESLSKQGFIVLREKIETVPWHPAAPSHRNEGSTMPPHCYFESHIPVLCPRDREGDLRELCSSAGVHMSRNAFKKVDDNCNVIMVTMRNSDTMREEFDRALAEVTATLENADFDLGKVITEFSVFDTRQSYDSSWIAARSASPERSSFMQGVEKARDSLRSKGFKIELFDTLERVNDTSEEDA